MGLKRYLTIMILATVLCWGSLALVVFFVDPQQTGILGIIFFYLAIFFTTIGSASLLGYLLRRFTRPTRLTFIQVRNSFRQGLWFGMLVVISLFLQSKGLASWWNLILLVFVFAFFELFWSSLQGEK